ncbi:hypothetical protein BDV95DRAFT_563525 [Massariosphaeria phaeospora]|uniref:Prokaryotic phospholipase A2-domain-containing protein n=1 Tax=Massariosphaeria phaeospora TaxID=100035 RepID=A0A7C8IE23_9PLEO|nr:hypothetical protein BDV95DRAFT_563525 [Massariosphaeria phaeospora]
MKINIFVLLAVFTTSSIACKCVEKNNHQVFDDAWTKRACDYAYHSSRFEDGDCKADSIAKQMGKFAKMCRGKKGYESDCDA